MLLASRRSVVPRRLRRGAPAGLLLLLTAVAAGEPATQFTRCDSAKAQPLAQLKAQCAGLAVWLTSTGLEGTLDRHSRDRVSAGDLSRLWERFEGLPGFHPDQASLAQVAEEINGPLTIVPEGWWERVKAWVRDWFRRHAPDRDGALNRWLERLAHSSGFLSTLGYGCIALIVAAAGGVILNELYRAGILRRRRHAPAQPKNDADRAPVTPPPTGGVADLMQRLVHCLEDTKRLSGGRSLTHRELIRAARLDTEDQRQAFSDIAARAERTRYDVRTANTEPDTAPLQRGEALLRELSVAGGG